MFLKYLHRRGKESSTLNDQWSVIKWSVLWFDGKISWLHEKGFPAYFKSLMCVILDLNTGCPKNLNVWAVPAKEPWFQEVLFSVYGIDEIITSILQPTIFKSDLYSQRSSPKHARSLRQPKTDDYWIILLLSMNGLEKIIEINLTSN